MRVELVQNAHGLGWWRARQAEKIGTHPCTINPTTSTHGNLYSPQFRSHEETKIFLRTDYLLVELNY